MHDERVFPKPKEFIPERFLETKNTNDGSNGLSIKVYFCVDMAGLYYISMTYFTVGTSSYYISVTSILTLGG